MHIGILEPDRYPEKALQLLRNCGEVHLHAGSVPLGEFLSKLDVAVIRLKYFLNRAFLDQAPQLKCIATATTGLDHIDLACTEERGITVLSLRGETAFLKTVTATAEHTWGLLLALLRHIPEAHYSVLRGDWDRDRFFGRELQHRTLGIVGLGRIGQMVARYGMAFRMNVLAFDPYQGEWLDGVTRMNSLEALLQESEIISVHVPLSAETTHLLGAKEFGLIKPGGVVVNTSRGAILDESALIANLESGHLSGAALDVIHDEYAPASGLRERLIRYAAANRNLIITPHLAGATHDSLEKVELFMAEKLVRHLRSVS